LRAACKTTPPLLLRSPLDGLAWPRYAAKRFSVWTEEEVATFLDAMSASPQAHVPHSVWRTLVVTGARLGEVLGMTPASVSDKGITIAQQVTRTPEGTVILKGSLKTKRSYRTVQIDAETADVLRAHRKAQAEARLAAGPEWIETGLRHPGGLA